MKPKKPSEVPEALRVNIEALRKEAAELNAGIRDLKIEKFRDILVRIEAFNQRLEAYFSSLFK